MIYWVLMVLVTGVHDPRFEPEEGMYVVGTYMSELSCEADQKPFEETGYISQCVEFSTPNTFM
jgi:hypothetical protein